MKTYHVHVYEVSGKVEFDIEADTAEQAQQIALNKIERVWWFGKSDCNHIALIPDVWG